MIFLTEHYALTKGPIHDALKEATEIVDRWGAREGNKDAYEVMLGWPWADLRDNIASSLLSARGWDTDYLEERCAWILTNPSAVMDEIADWERRGPTLK